MFCQCSLGSDWTHLPELDSDGEDSEQHDSDLEETPEIFDKDYLEAISDAVSAFGVACIVRYRTDSGYLFLDNGQ